MTNHSTRSVQNVVLIRNVGFIKNGQHEYECFSFTLIAENWKCCVDVNVRR